MQQQLPEQERFATTTTSHASPTTASYTLTQLGSCQVQALQLGQLCKALAEAGAGQVCLHVCALQDEVCDAACLVTLHCTLVAQVIISTGGLHTSSKTDQAATASRGQ